MGLTQAPPDFVPDTDLALWANHAGVGIIDVSEKRLYLDSWAADLFQVAATMASYTPAIWTLDLDLDAHWQLHAALASVEHGDHTHFQVATRIDTDDDAAPRWVETCARVIAHDAAGRPTRMVALFIDITAHCEANARAASESQIDALTGLGTRSALFAVLQDEARRVRRLGGQCSLILLDLTRFARTNESVGAAAGDEILRIVAQRLSKAFPTARRLARFDGDRFAIVFVDVLEDAELAKKAQLAIEAVNMPMEPLGLRARLSASAGYSRLPEPSVDEHALLGDAEAALNIARTAGPGSVQRYGHALVAQQRADARVAQDLRKALSRNGLSLHYQPIIDLQDFTVRGFEALLRWQRGGDVPTRPDVVLRTAHREGLSDELVSWVLRTATQQMAEWKAQGLATSVWLNITPEAASAGFFQKAVRQALDRTALPSERLCLEITEEALATPPEGLVPAIEALRAMGVQVAVDDFGAGYSSLSRLRHLPVDVLKIDRSFLSRLPADPIDISIIKAVVDLGNARALRVVAEGVETEAQLKAVQQVGCHCVQGFLFSPAMAADEVVAWARAQHAKAAGLTAITRA